VPFAWARIPAYGNIWPPQWFRYKPSAGRHQSPGIGGTAGRNVPQTPSQYRFLVTDDLGKALNMKFYQSPKIFSPPCLACRLFVAMSGVLRNMVA